MQTVRHAGRQIDRHSLSECNFTVQWDVGGCLKKKSRGSVYVSSHRAAERWPLSRVTDYRSLMLPRRLPRLAEMNHPSAFFCKPSITSDFSPQTSTPPPPTHPPYTHSHTFLHTHIRRGYSTKSHRGWVLLTNQLKLCENTAPSYILLLFVCQPLSSRSPCLSHSHISLYMSCQCQPSFLSPAPLSILPLLCFPFLFRSSSPPHCALYHSGISVSCVSLGISLPSTTEQANHCWHFKRHWIKWPTVGWVCGSTICSMTSTSQQTLSFVSGLAS